MATVKVFKTNTKTTSKNNTDVIKNYEQTFFENIYKTCQQIGMASGSTSNLLVVPEGYVVLITSAHVCGNSAGAVQHVYVSVKNEFIFISHYSANAGGGVSVSFPHPIIVYPNQTIYLNAPTAAGIASEGGFVGFLVPLSKFS